jgi:hypothetical protein
VEAEAEHWWAPVFSIRQWIDGYVLRQETVFSQFFYYFLSFFFGSLTCACVRSFFLIFFVRWQRRNARLHQCVGYYRLHLVSSHQVFFCCKKSHKIYVYACSKHLSLVRRAHIYIYIYICIYIYIYYMYIFIYVYIVLHSPLANKPRP